MTPWFADSHTSVYAGRLEDVLPSLGEASVDSVVCDPPYELGFMGKSWDASGVAYQPGTWGHVLRVLKPGGHLLAFGGTRTYHRMAVAVEDAGFEVRDTIAWMYGSGFPKSLDVSKAIDKAAGAEREVVGEYAAPDGKSRGPMASFSVNGMHRWGDQWYSFDELPANAQEYVRGAGRSDGDSIRAVTAPATHSAKQWEGWGTALKPAHEPIVVARKPFAGTVAVNVLEHGTGALNIDGCRISARAGDYDHPGNDNRTERRAIYGADERNGRQVEPHASGRWPANVVLDPEAAAALDRQSGTLPSRPSFIGSGSGKTSAESGTSDWPIGGKVTVGYHDTGGASRFFYCAKASKADRGAGNSHPTVKPVELMRWLVRLVTPPDGTVLDPFAGSGTTLVAAVLEGVNVIGCEMTDEYLPLIDGRVAWAREQVANQQPTLL